MISKFTSKLFASIVVTALLSVSMLGCQSGAGNSNKNQLPQQMQQMKSKFLAAMTLAFDNKKFYDESQSQKNLTIIKEFAETAHKTDPAQAKDWMGVDPMVTYTLNNLQNQVASAERSFKDGHKSYAQTLLRHSVSACVQCHTRSKVGPQFYDAQALGALTVDPMTKADMLTATRNISEAQTTLKNYLLDPKNAEMNAFYRDKALKKYLAITLRFEENPKQAEEFLAQFSKTKGLNSTEQAKISEWTKSLQKWNREMGRKSFQGLRFRESDPQSLFLSSIDLSESRYIDHLRHAMELHKDLQNNKITDKAKIYLALGNIYDQLSETTYWEIPEVYYEACIRDRPKSLTAKSCFYRYQSRMVFGYTGSSGTFIPEEEIKKLNALKEAAGINR